MPRFFIDDHPGELARLAGEDARHIAKSLRMRPGEELVLCDGRGTDFRCAIRSVTPEEVTAQVLESVPSRGEPAVGIRLYQALPKGDKMEFIVQKAVELGVRDIVPVLTERCISRPDPRSMEKKILRYQKVALEAAKQSGRGIVPRVLPLQEYRDAVSGMKSYPAAILCYEKADEPLSAALSAPPAQVAVMVGSEGGFSEREARAASLEGVRLASLGTRILRCETAPLCALTAVLCACGEL